MKKHRLLPVLGYFLINAFISVAYADTHVIEKGETLWSIARNYYGDPKLYTRILELNPQITLTHQLRPGEVIQLGPPDPKAAPEPPKPKERPRPFEWTKEFHPDDYQYIVSVKDATGAVFFTHQVPPVDMDYRDRRVNKKPGEQMTLTELNDRNHPYSDCDFTLHTKFHNDELYRLIRQNHPVIMSQINAIGEVTFKDVNYDGKEDLIIAKGTYGALDIAFVDILLWDEASQTFVQTKRPYLTSVGNVLFNDDDKTITFTKQTCQENWNYYKYRIDDNHKFSFIETVAEECGRHITLERLYKISEAELEATPVICNYRISNTVEGKESNYDINDGFDKTQYTFSQLNTFWQGYIQGADHPSLLKAKVIDYPTLYKRNHTLHFNSVEEMQKWEAEHNAIHGLPF